MAYLAEERAAEALASANFGILTTDEALGVGMSKRAIQSRISNGRWTWLLPGVLRVSASEVTQQQGALGACRWLESRSVVGGLSHVSAGVAWGLSSLDAMSDLRSVSITLNAWRQPPANWLHVHVDRSIAPDDIVGRGRCGMTSMPRTLIDLAGTLETDLLESCLEEAFRRNLCTFEQIERVLPAFAERRHKGVKALRGLLRVRGEGRPAESELELRVLRALRRARLPEPERQVSVKTSSGKTRRIDLAYPTARLAIECDGYRYHSGRHAWQEDLVRRNELAELGWHVIHVTHWDLQGDTRRIVRFIRDCLRHCPAGPAVRMPRGVEVEYS